MPPKVTKKSYFRKPRTRKGKNVDVRAGLPSVTAALGTVQSSDGPALQSESSRPSVAPQTSNTLQPSHMPQPLNNLPPATHSSASGGVPHCEQPSNTLTAPERLEKYGLLPLTANVNDVTLDSQSPDIVAIHGINGDAYSTWTNTNGAFWLRDFLPEQIPGARVFTFGYPSEVAFTRATGDIVAFGRALLEQLKAYRSGEVNIYLVIHLVFFL
jgi:hypothetical protein